MLLPPINFTKWLAENEDKLQPPVNNYLLFRGEDTICMVVGGPNKRTDYHVNETEVKKIWEVCCQKKEEKMTNNDLN